MSSNTLNGFCHACQRRVALNQNDSGMSCPICNGEFVELVDPRSNEFSQDGDGMDAMIGQAFGNLFFRLGGGMPGAMPGPMQGGFIGGDGIFRSFNVPRDGTNQPRQNSTFFENVVSSDEEELSDDESTSNNRDHSGNESRDSDSVGSQNEEAFYNIMRALFSQGRRRNTRNRRSDQEAEENQPEAPNTNGEEQNEMEGEADSNIPRRSIINPFEFIPNDNGGANIEFEEINSEEEVQPEHPRRRFFRFENLRGSDDDQEVEGDSGRRRRNPNDQSNQHVANIVDLLLDAFGRNPGDDSEPNAESNARRGYRIGDYFVGGNIDDIITELMDQVDNPIGEPPASDVALAKLTTEVIDEPDLTCHVCLEIMPIGETVKAMPDCKHKFHETCLIPWLKEHNSCPVCRKPIEDPEREQQEELRRKKIREASQNTQSNSSTHNQTDEEENAINSGNLSSNQRVQNNGENQNSSTNQNNGTNQGRRNNVENIFGSIFSRNMFS